MQWSYSVLLHILASDPCRGYSNSSRFHARPLFDRGPCVLPAQTTVLTAEPSGPRPRRSPRWTLRPPGTQANKLYGGGSSRASCHVGTCQTRSRLRFHTRAATCNPHHLLPRQQTSPSESMDHAKSTLYKAHTPNRPSANTLHAHTACSHESGPLHARTLMIQASWCAQRAQPPVCVEDAVHAAPCRRIV